MLFRSSQLGQELRGHGGGLRSHISRHQQTRERWSLVAVARSGSTGTVMAVDRLPVTWHSNWLRNSRTLNSYVVGYLIMTKRRLLKLRTCCEFRGLHCKTRNCGVRSGRQRQPYSRAFDCMRNPGEKTKLREQTVEAIRCFTGCHSFIQRIQEITC